MDTLTTFTGRFDLERWPQQKNDSLKAWDAADEYLLNHLAEQESFKADRVPRMLIINDSHGALACALHEFAPLSWSDSYLAHESGQQNLTLNDIDGTLRTLESTETPEGSYDLVLVRIPKTTALLDDQLAKLSGHLHAKSVVIAAGMIKHMQKSAFASFEKYIGPVSTSLAAKKARLIFAQVDESLQNTESAGPSYYTEQGLNLLNHANVFSREQLDLGARYLLSHFDQLPAATVVIDLACGNGILGLRYKQLHANAQLHFADESYMAIASSRDNYQRAFAGREEDAQFYTANGLQHHADSCADLILCNPPFHQQHVVGDQVATGMFDDSKRCLKQGGELWVVANRHLTYGNTLKRLFGNCRGVGSNKKFSVLRVVKR